MTLRRPLTAALAAVLLGVVPAHKPHLIAFSAPAGDRAAGAPNAARPYDVILPNGRIVAPVGISTVVGTNALGVALSPNGRYAIVGNDSALGDGTRPALNPAIQGGYSLSVVDTETMRVVDVHHVSGEAFFGGIVALRDPANPSQTIVLACGGTGNDVRVFDLGAGGTLTEEPAAIAIPGSTDPRDAHRGNAFPASIALSFGGRIAYVASAFGNSVAAIDVAGRRLLHRAPVGFFPSGVAVSGKRVYVTNGGVMQYMLLPQPVQLPQFAGVADDPQRASSLTSVATLADADVDPNSASQVSLAMDRAPDGTRIIGGAHPEAIAISRDGRYAYVCMSNVDRVAIVSLSGIPRVVGGLSLQLFTSWPYGTQPTAIVRSKDGKRLYVALSGINAVAVLDARHPAKIHRLGLIPTGWYPSALALSPNGRYLYVANAKGLGENGDSDTLWSTLQRVDLHRLPLQKVTLSALRYTRVATVAKADPIVPPLRSLRRSSVVKHVVVIVADGASPDAPNLRALRNDFASARTMYADGGRSADAHLFATGGIATVFSEEMLPVEGADAAWGSQDPEDYPRAGYVFNALARAHRTFRDYGEMLRISGYEGGRFILDVPALSALAGNVDPAYFTTNQAGGDVRRAAEFERDIAPYVQEGTFPDFTYVRLSSPLSADEDDALGSIVQYLTHVPQWSSMAIFITTDGAADASGNRRVAVVVSPFAKHGYESRRHLSTVSMLKTEEELLGMPPLALNDLLATDMADFFTSMPDATPFTPAAPAASAGTAAPGYRTVPKR